MRVTDLSDGGNRMKGFAGSLKKEYNEVCKRKVFFSPAEGRLKMRIQLFQI